MDSTETRRNEVGTDGGQHGGTERALAVNSTLRHGRTERALTVGSTLRHGGTERALKVDSTLWHGGTERTPVDGTLRVESTEELRNGADH